MSNQYLPISDVISKLALGINTAISYRSDLVTINSDVAVSAVRRLEQLLGDLDAMNRNLDEASNELAWLIEARISPALWLQADPIAKTYRWTADANDAVRFARKIDAENIIGLWSLQAAHATEHMWCSPQTTRGEFHE